jgi:hypothetical protein
MADRLGRPSHGEIQSMSSADFIRFGSFSLGDVMNQEIQKFGRFAFRDKRSNGEASKKFVEGFTRSAPQFGRTGERRRTG